MKYKQRNNIKNIALIICGILLLLFLILFFSNPNFLILNSIKKYFLASTSDSVQTVYYVAKNGNDSNLGTESQPFLTVNKGVSVLKAGYTLYIGPGEYNESLINNIPGGESWDKPVTVTALTPKTVTLKPSAGPARVIQFSGDNQKYIIINGLILDGQNVTYDTLKMQMKTMNDSTGVVTGTPHHIKIINCEIMNAPGQGILVAPECNDNQFINLKVHDNGTSRFDHGMYISSHNNIIENCEVYDNSGWGIHVYNGYKSWKTQNNIIRNNIVHNNNTVNQDGVGIGIYSGDGNVAYNNIVWGNHIGIVVDYGATNTKIYNNTSYGNTSGSLDGDRGDGISIGYVSRGVVGTIVKNNISYGSRNPSHAIDNDGANTILSNNFTNDPKFVDAANHNFQLASDSPAIDAGATLTEFNTDIIGTSRPQGAGWDIGAYEAIYYSCGNETCSNGETCLTCPADCGSCPADSSPFCGDGTCNNGETCSSCSPDCGACSLNSNSSTSNTPTEWGATGPKYAPTNLIATADGNEIKLSWGDAQDTSKISEYKIYRCENSSSCYPYKEIASTTKLSYTDTSVLSSTPYGYAIRGYGYAGVSPISNIAYITSNDFWATVKTQTTTSESATPATTTVTEPTTAETTTTTTETTATATPATTTTIVFTEKLYVGVRSEQVTQLQTFLAKYPDIYPEGKVTGYFWTATYNAVGKFQLKYGIVASSSSAGYGIVGPKTRDKLNELVNLGK